MNFYKYDGSYYTADNHQKIANLDELNKLSKAGGKEITYAPDSSWEKIANEQAIPNYDVKGQYGSTLYGIKKQPTMVGNDLATNLPDNTVDQSLKILAENASKNSEANQLKYTQMKETEQKLKEAEAEQAKIQAEKQGQIDDFNEKIQPSIDKTVDMYNSAVDAFSQTDFQEKYDKLQTLENDIVNYSQLLNEELDGVQTSGRLYGMATAEKNRIKENYTSKIYTAQASISAIQGNLTFAFDIIDKGANSIKQINSTQKSFLETINAMFADREEDADDKVSTLTTEQKDQINNLITELETKEQLVEANKEKLMELMRENPTIAHEAGLTYTDTEEEWTQKIMDYYTTHPEANPENTIQTLDGYKWLVSPSGEKLKNLGYAYSGGGSGSSGAQATIKVGNIEIPDTGDTFTDTVAYLDALKQQGMLNDFNYREQISALMQEGGYSEEQRSEVESLVNNSLKKLETVRNSSDTEIQNNQSEIELDNNPTSDFVVSDGKQNQFGTTAENMPDVIGVDNNPGSGVVKLKNKINVGYIDENGNFVSNAQAFKKELEKEAPETLKEPMRSMFDTLENYQKAVERFKRLGHWATPDPSLSDEEKKLYELSVK